MPKTTFYVGTYTQNTTSKGIYQFALDENGRLDYRSACGDGMDNPSYLAIEGRYVYAANERAANGFVSCYRIHPVDGSLQYQNACEVPGSGLCHVVVWPGAPYLVGANYSSGSFVSLGLAPGGELGSLVQVHQDEGSGPNAARQDGPHAHSLTPSPRARYLIGCDLGTDEVWVFEACGTNGHFSPNVNGGCYKTDPGDGPRHTVFSPFYEHMYVICELSNTIRVYDYSPESGVVEFKQKVGTLPEGFAGENTAAAIDITPDGRFLYASNRGADTLACYAVNPLDGTLAMLDSYPCGGKGPRDFAISPDGAFLVAANQMSDSIAVFRRDATTGELLEMTDTFTVPQAVCIAFRP